MDILSNFINATNLKNDKIHRTFESMDANNKKKKRTKANLKETDNLEDLITGYRIILKRILEKWGERVGLDYHGAV